MFRFFVGIEARVFVVCIESFLFKKVERQNIVYDK